MKVLIVEPEIYLAQSIYSKLSEIGYTPEIATTLKEATKDKDYDIILLSTNVSGQDFYPIISKHKKAIIILMISYISNDTVSNPLQAGANDYIVKPFMMEELIRKIEHFIDYEKLKKDNQALHNYIDFSFEDIIKENLKINIRDNLPLLVKTNYQKYADAFVFHYAKVNKKSIEFVSLSNPEWKEHFYSIARESIIYLAPLQNVKKSDKKDIIDVIKGRSVIISSLDSADELPINTIELKSDNRVFDKGSVLSIDDYIKFVVVNCQNKYPDTELSKKLGISRKSLWEKRKKYGITKKK